MSSPSHQSRALGITLVSSAFKHLRDATGFSINKQPDRSQLPSLRAASASIDQLAHEIRMEIERIEAAPADAVTDIGSWHRHSLLSLQRWGIYLEKVRL